MDVGLYRVVSVAATARLDARESAVQIHSEALRKDLSLRELVFAQGTWAYIFGPLRSGQRSAPEACMFSVMASKLSDIEIQRSLGARTGWTRRGNALTRTFEFPSFAEGIAFVNRVAEVADGMDHHPDIDIRYTKITFSLSTHSAGGITQRDFRLAEAIDAEANK